ncbi:MULTISPECIES: excalibur calcium-binding domain-containing protein [Micromonospora]|uniref:Excalibur calcium-binding domain-containing protein n=1 Tax=Micromonospora antibiotica TaxID=2807623 RepID=A0ABS3VBR4_9ACTN|nr:MULTISPECIES: excalibur calcium-binding domain-containing protein [Micromonospora]MBO4163029.1 excalibur calcium-binding domain-containing protein [Micromonospora antibiotica]MBW4704824.1 excalibur calcium-binding domain-containing protein [Micromonospora sp. RL09-050-HVF-A]
MVSILVRGALAVTLALGSTLVVVTGPAEAAATKYKNCTELNKKYKHGVGKKGAKDKVRGSTKPVTNFTVSDSVYAKNTHLDRDKDKVACEKR